ncbi:MAG: hypothetical protein GC139_09595 [Sideroxydans sp.]|nr:hypothetical protein [Sideroxydans sp.]
MGYSIASGELKQIGTSATTNGIIEASTMEIGGKTLHDVSYNKQMANSLKINERIALLLTPTGFIAALRRQNGEIVYSNDESRENMERPIPYPYYIFMGVLGLITTFGGIGLIIIVRAIKSFMERKDIENSFAEFKRAAL